MAEAREYFGSGVDFYLDGGSRGRGDASSVVEFLDDRAYLRREGGLGRERLAAVVSLEG